MASWAKVLARLRKEFVWGKRYHFQLNLRALLVEWRDADLMEEEVLVIRERGSMTFNFHRSIFAKVVGKHLRSLRPLSMEVRGERVVLRLNQEEGEELRAWLLLNLDKGFFITELECLELC